MPCFVMSKMIGFVVCIAGYFLQTVFMYMVFLIRNKFPGIKIPKYGINRIDVR